MSGLTLYNVGLRNRFVLDSICNQDLSSPLKQFVITAPLL